MRHRRHERGGEGEWFDMTLRWMILVAALPALALGCGDDGGDGGGDMDGGVDAGPVDGGPPPVPGCTDEDASNYDEDATVDDGSCTYTVTFAVDMTGVDYDRADGVGIESSFCSDDCPTLSDDDEDEVWEGTVDLTTGSYTGRFVITSATPRPETVPEFCQAEGSDARSIVVADAPVEIDPVAFGACTVLPLAVDGFYSASGFFGDAGNISVTVDECPTRPTDPVGACREWSYTPGAQNFGGVFWQFPENNFGAQPGYPIPQGATRVRFWAWGASGGEQVEFIVGYGPNEEFGQRDGFEINTGAITLNDEPTEYFVDLFGVDYELVAGGFGWVASGAQGAITFFLDDIAWERRESDLLPRGCTDEDATNYDPAAVNDDGSCTYEVTFSVDMNCPDPDDAFETVWVTGEFCDFCDSGFPLLDPDEDGVYEGTFPFRNGPVVYKFMTNNFASQEDLLDDVIAGEGDCAPVTDGAAFANRQLVVDGDTSVSAVYGTCAATCP